MPRGTTSKTTVQIQRLLEERRQYESWIVRLSSASDSTPEHVRQRVRADYEARLKAVTEELKVHADSARQSIDQKRHLRGELQQKEARAAERLAETELRHAVGEYDEAQWIQVHKDALAELVSVREELQGLETEMAQLEELNVLVRVRPPAPSERPAPRVGPPPKPAARLEEPREDERRKQPVDEQAFLKSVTEDEKGGAPSPRRASGAQFQPAIPATSARTASSSTPGAAPSSGSASSADDDVPDAVKTLKCRECGTMNLPTEWYCENCGAELAAL